MNKTLALLVRAFRSESRDIKSHLVRGGLVMVILLFFLVHVSEMQYETAPGRTMFQWMTWANWALITFAGGAVFSVAISEETEQQTLGLLRMANIGPLSLLLGKWLPRLWVAFLLVSAQFPFTWLTITLGGVSWEQISASYMLLLAHLFFVGNLALFCSVWRQDNASAGAWTFSLLVLWRVGPLLLWGLAELLAEVHLFPQDLARSLGEMVGRHNRCTATGSMTLDLLRTSFSGGIWTDQVISSLGMGALLFGLSWLLFDRLTLRHLMGGVSSTVPLIQKLMQGGSRRSRRVWNWAIGWKDFRQVAGGKRSIILKLSLYALVTMGVIAFYIAESGSPYIHLPEILGGVLSWVILVIVLPLELGSTAAKLFRPELKDQTWSTLLTLPKSVPEIAYSKLGGALLGLIPTFCVLFLALTPFLVDIVEEFARDPEVLLGFAYGFSVIILCLHAITYFSITVGWAATPIAMILGVVTTGATQIIPWIGFAFLMMAVSGSSEQGVFYIWMMMFTTANLMGTGVVHWSIGKELSAKGAAS